MKRRILSLTLVLVLCMVLALPVNATPPINFVVDEWDVLADSEAAQLNAQAEQIYQDTGIGIFFVFSNAETLETLNPNLFAGAFQDYYIMIENDDYWWSFAGGKGKHIDETIENTLRAAYNSEDTYVDGIAAYLVAAAPYAADCGAAYGNSGSVETIGQLLVLDEADLLSESEISALNTKLLNIGDTYQAQIVIATIASLNGADIDEYINFAYDQMGIGYGSNRDGVLLLLCMDEREYRILTNGMADAAIGESGIDSIGDTIVSDLSDGDYAEAFDKFADECAYYLNGHLNGFPFNVRGSLTVALIVGVLAGIVVASILKGQLKTVRKQNQANEYVKPGSLQLTVNNDFFLYRTVDRRKKESSSSSSSGSSRSVGGGKF